MLFVMTLIRLKSWMRLYCDMGSSISNLRNPFVYFEICLYDFVNKQTIQQLFKQQMKAIDL